MALGRRILTALIAIALALAPVGAASAVQMSSGQAAQTLAAPHAQTSHAHMHHDHAAMSSDHNAGHHCEGNGTAKRTGCCDDKSTCAQTCLLKCFGQIAMMAPERASQKVLALRLAPQPAERPPGWASAPQLPPPRA